MAKRVEKELSHWYVAKDGVLSSLMFADRPLSEVKLIGMRWMDTNAKIYGVYVTCQYYKRKFK